MSCWDTGRYSVASVGFTFRPSPLLVPRGQAPAVSRPAGRRGHSAGTGRRDVGRPGGMGSNRDVCRPWPLVPHTVLVHGAHGACRCWSMAPLVEQEAWCGSLRLPAARVVLLESSCSVSTTIYYALKYRHKTDTLTETVSLLTVGPWVSRGASCLGPCGPTARPAHRRRESAPHRRDGV